MAMFVAEKAQQRPSSVPSFGGAVLVGFVLVASFLILTSDPAKGASCAVNGDGGHGWDNSDPGRHFGNRSGSPGIAVRDTSVACFRVSSLYVVKDSNNFVEIGWYDGDDGPGGCDTVTTPHVLVYRMVQGTPACKSGTPGVPVTSSPNDGTSFRVENPEHDNDWEYYWDGDYQGFYWSGFDKGLINGGAERHNTTDSAWGNLTGLRWMGSAGNWNDWQSTSGTSTDPDYHFCKYSDTHIASKQVC
jgi:hypothetical protein